MYIKFDRSICLVLAFGLALAKPNQSIAQAAPEVSVAVRQNISILIPLHLDSLFRGDSYRYGNSIPKFAIANLEFFNGVQLAADSLRLEGVDARIAVTDSRNNAAVRNVFMGADKPDLIIAVVQSIAELKILSDLAATRQIPFVNASYPNDGGLTAKPNLIMVNTTLRTHCHNLYKYLQRQHSTDNLLLVTRKGNTDDRLKAYLAEAEKNTAALKLNWKSIQLSDSFSAKELTPYLDSLATNTVVVSSLDEDFGKRVIRGLSSHKANYTTNAFGMPTWDEFALTRPEFNGVDVYYSTAFISFTGNPKLYNWVNKKFTATTKSRPSDMVFRGFEITYRMVKTAVMFPNAFMDHLNEPGAKLFNDFSFEPVRISNNQEGVPDYYENKKVYFVKKVDGLVKGVY